MSSTSEAATVPKNDARWRNAFVLLTKVIGLLACVGGLIWYSLRWEPLGDLLREDHNHFNSFTEHRDRDHSNSFTERQTLLWLIFEHWLPITTIAVVTLIVAGRVGSSLGLPGLFRDPSRDDLAEERIRRQNPEYVHSRGLLTSFLGAMGATFLVAEVWAVIFYTEIIENLPDLDPGHFRGESDYFELYAGFQFWNHGDLLWFLLVSGLPFLGLLLLAELFPANAPGMERRGREFFAEAARFALGISVGVFVVFGMAKFGALFHWISEPVWRSLIYPALKKLSLLKLLKIEEMYPDPASEDVRIQIMASFSQFILMVLLFYLGLAFLRRRLSPGLGICMVLSFGILFFAVLAMLSTLGQVLLLGLVLGWFVFANGDGYKYRFPGMQEYYRENGRVTEPDLKEALKRSADELNLLNNESVLENWREATGQKKPKLILVATTGGAYRAAFWTTLVLDELGRHLGNGFHRHIRLITGASGGMVGAAYYVSKLQKSGPPENGVTDFLSHETGLDSLTPVARQLVLRDLPMGFFWYKTQLHDRGIELEKEWRSLERTFSDLSQGESEGWRPSLVISPMVVESGRRLLISNLDLSVLAETRPLRQAPFADQTALAEGTARLYSSSAVEFFRIFPKARTTFSLQTAVRMSATFPLASPAVSLPTDPPRRVVDAGYYDNYGVDLATSWAYEHQDWIRDNTSGLALIQIRAYPNEKDIQTYFGLAAATTGSLGARFLGRLIRSFQGLTSPLAGGLSAREASMRFRNATQVRLLDDLFNRDGRHGFFETFVFENFDQFAMNWFISEHDIESMRRSIGGVDANPAGSEQDAMVGSGDGDIRAATARKTVDAAHEINKNNHEVKKKLAEWWGRA
jgi:hypothetical protein